MRISDWSSDVCSSDLCDGRSLISFPVLELCSLRLPYGFHHPASSRLSDRRRTYRHPRCNGHRLHWFIQCLRLLLRRQVGRAVQQKVTFGRCLFSARFWHSASNRPTSDPHCCLYVRSLDGRVLAGHRTTNARADRANIWSALRGHAIGHRVPGPSDREFHRCLDGRLCLPDDGKLYNSLVGWHCFGRRCCGALPRSEEHTSELQSLMRISYAVFCLKNKNNKQKINT